MPGAPADLLAAAVNNNLGDGRDDDAVDDLDQRIMERLQYSGRAYPSNAVVDGRFVLRACIVNFRTEAEHVESLVDLAVATGDELATWRDRPISSKTVECADRSIGLERRAHST